jgi:hypothetical protein
MLPHPNKERSALRAALAGWNGIEKEFLQGERSG